MKFLQALYNLKGVIRRIAVLFAWLFGIQTAVLFMLAVGADQPLPVASVPVVKFLTSLILVYWSGRIIDAVIRKIVRYKAAQGQ